MQISPRFFVCASRRIGFAFFGLLCATLGAREPDLVLPLWPGTPPGDTKTLPPEADQTKDTDTLIAGRRIIKLGNVSTPQLAVYRPTRDKDTGAAVIIAPGGGFNILAYDLEGTEVAEWFNSIGVTGIVLKYRVPFRDPAKRWLAATQDVQRAMSLVRSKAGEWRLDAARIGVLGFSAGGAAAAIASIQLEQRHYDAIDAADRVSSRPDFTMLIYTGRDLIDPAKGQLREEYKIPANVPPMFFVHAFNDDVPVFSPLLLAAEVKKAGGSAEVHIYDAGGHGYGLRPVATLPVTTWPKRAEEWMARRGLLKAGASGAL
jgi:acetyl esterase/lipase